MRIKIITKLHSSLNLPNCRVIGRILYHESIFSDGKYITPGCWHTDVSGFCAGHYIPKRKRECKRHYSKASPEFRPYHSRAKLSLKQLEELKKKLPKYKNVELARRYGISAARVGQIRNSL